ncbi:uncharacterized protein LOC131934858 [Physella acuta]|uniref:uncharacterized protein LOC131934858 n=1 Tax=Physella acuta TaxID=109671 RepID=UPI0027DBC65B|nr:uncharacterized protein LOC131934858 [Physella acuta]
MDVSWRWQLPILLMVFCPILGCGTSGAQCQDNSSLGNDSIYTQDTIAKGSLSNEGIRHGMNDLGRLPHDVRCTGHDERSSVGEMDFSNNFNTCPANETVGNLPCVDITGGSTGKTIIEQDLGFTFQLDVLGVCFNVTVIEVNGEKIDYIEMFEKLNPVSFREESANDSTLYKTEISESDEMEVDFPSNFVVHISENKSRILNVTGFTNTGKCREFGIPRKVAEVFPFKESEIPRLREALRKYKSRSEMAQNLMNAMFSGALAILVMIICRLKFLTIKLQLINQYLENYLERQQRQRIGRSCWKHRNSIYA